jgi:hypothetical protein
MMWIVSTLMGFGRQSTATLRLLAIFSADDGQVALHLTVGEIAFT